MDDGHETLEEYRKRERLRYSMMTDDEQRWYMEQLELEAKLAKGRVDAAKKFDLSVLEAEQIAQAARHQRDSTTNMQLNYSLGSDGAGLHDLDSPGWDPLGGSDE